MRSFAVVEQGRLEGENVAGIHSSGFLMPSPLLVRFGGVRPNQSNRGTECVPQTASALSPSRLPAPALRSAKPARAKIAFR
jgi:hypothetical protein